MAKFSVKSARRFMAAFTAATAMFSGSAMLPSGLLAESVGILAAQATTPYSINNVNPADVQMWVNAHTEGWVQRLYGNDAVNAARYVEGLLNKIRNGQQLTEAEINSVNWQLLDRTNAHDLPWAVKWFQFKGVLFSYVQRPAPQISPAESRSASEANAKAIAEQNQQQSQEQQQLQEQYSEAWSHAEAMAKGGSSEVQIRNELANNPTFNVSPQIAARIASHVVNNNSSSASVGNVRGSDVNIQGDRIDSVVLPGRQATQTQVSPTGEACVADLEAGQLVTRRRAGMRTRAGTAINIDGTVTNGTVSAGVGFARTGSAEGVTGQECLEMQAEVREVQGAIADQLTSGQINILDFVVRPVGDTTTILNAPAASAEQRQWIQDGQTGSFQR